MGNNMVLKEFRNSNNKTQKEMAEIIGVSESFYKKIETGERGTSYNFISKFREVFPKVNIDEIFFSKS